MKIKLRSDDASMPQDNDWAQTDGWLAALRDDSQDDTRDDIQAYPADDGHVGPARDGDARPEVPAVLAARAEAAAARAEGAARVASTVRAVIGDQLRMPVLWCELGSCVSWYADPAALGEADNRARAINAGWRIDALGRLACPSCQQTDAGFWATDPVVPWDRHTAIARAAAVGGHPYAGPSAPRRQSPAQPFPRRSP